LGRGRRGFNALPGELYNLRKDLSQKHNLYAEQPEKVAEMQTVLDELRKHGQVRKLSE